MRSLTLSMMLAVSMPSLAQVASEPAARSAAELFGARESVQQVDISPDGQTILYLGAGPGRSTAAYTAQWATGGEPKRMLASRGNPHGLKWCKFVTNTRAICQLSWVARVDGVLVPYTRLLAIGIDGGKPAVLGERASLYDSRIRQFDGEIVDWLPEEEGAVLMAREYVPEEGKFGTRLVRTKDGLGIDRIDVNTLVSTRVENAVKAADFFLSDGRGNVRIKGYRPDHGGTGQLAGNMVYHYRATGSSNWLPLSTWDGDQGMYPLAVDGESNSAYMGRKLDGRIALYRFRLDGSSAMELVYKNDKVDVDGVVRIGRGSRVIGVTFAEEKRSVIYFDAEYRRIAASLGKAIPELPLIDFVGSSSNNTKLLVHAGSDADPGRYYVYDKAAGTLNEILLAREGLEGTMLASVKPISYPATDGTAIPGYLTLPPGKQDARGLPAVVLPHGGPSARDEWGFDWLAQFLANQGYAVLQPNYRGSAGFGDAWMQENGFRSWRTSIGDVTAAANWLVDQGIADPRRLAIVGWSYGGYAALQAGVVEPSLFKALVAIAPVTDLGKVKADARHYTSARITEKYIGTGEHIKEGSPLRNVDRIAAPVLMFHGDVDLNVRVRQSREMDEKLRAAGKVSELVVYEGLEHSLVDSSARAGMLEKIAAFLASSMGSGLDTGTQ